MALPEEYRAIKLHPAIGVARVSANDDYYVYNEHQGPFKSGGRIMRQAVRFRLFAYGDQNRGIEELTPGRLAELGVRVRWKARVGNRKVSLRTGDPAHVIEASAASDDGQGGRLIGTLPEADGGEQVHLGRILTDGLFVPPVAQIAETRFPIPPVGFTDGNHADNSADGAVTAELLDADSGTVIDSVPVLGAWVFIAPPDFAPDTDDSEEYPGRPDADLEQFFVNTLLLSSALPANPVNRTARQIDRDALRRCTGDFAPGIEADMGRFDATALRMLLWPNGVTGDRDEIRVRPRPDGTNLGAVPGELTQGLCSPWQYDFSICTCSYWAAQRPDAAFRDSSAQEMVKWLRKSAADEDGSDGVLSGTREFIDHVYELGIHREQQHLKIETERDNDIP